MAKDDAGIRRTPRQALGGGFYRLGATAHRSATTGRYITRSHPQKGAGVADGDSTKS